MKYGWIGGWMVIFSAGALGAPAAHAMGGAPLRRASNVQVYIHCFKGKLSLPFDFAFTTEHGRRLDSSGHGWTLQFAADRVFVLDEASGRVAFLGSLDQIPSDALCAAGTNGPAIPDAGVYWDVDMTFGTDILYAASLGGCSYYHTNGGGWLGGPPQSGWERSVSTSLVLRSAEVELDSRTWNSTQSYLTQEECEKDSL